MCNTCEINSNKQNNSCLIMISQQKLFSVYFLTSKQVLVVFLINRQNLLSVSTNYKLSDAFHKRIYNTPLTCILLMASQPSCTVLMSTYTVCWGSKSWLMMDIFLFLYCIVSNAIFYFSYVCKYFNNDDIDSLFCSLTNLHSGFFAQKYYLWSNWTS